MAVEAQSIDAQADCVAADFHLAAVAGLSTDKALPQPTSLPFAGHFQLPLFLRETAGANDSKARRAEAEIPRWEAVISDHAAALTEANAARAAATTDFFASRTTVEHVLATIDVQGSESVAFLQTLTDYNRAVAQNVMRHTAPNVSPEMLATALSATD